MCGYTLLYTGGTDAAPLPPPPPPPPYFHPADAAVGLGRTLLTDRPATRECGTGGIRWLGKWRLYDGEVSYGDRIDDTSRRRKGSWVRHFSQACCREIVGLVEMETRVK